MGAGVIIPAAGAGKRMGRRTGKQFLKLGRLSVLERAVSVFDGHPRISEIVVVLPKARMGRYAGNLCRRFKKVSAVVPGGPKRTQSVIRGFNALRKERGIVLVHDSVRPFVGRAAVSRAIAACKRHDAATVAVPAKDTIKIVNKTRILGTPNRKQLWHTQTPQAFRYGVLKACLDFAQRTRTWDTDECQLAEKLGKDVCVVLGDYFNFKITTPEDLVFARALVR